MLVNVQFRTPIFATSARCLDSECDSALGPICFILLFFDREGTLPVRFSDCNSQALHSQRHFLVAPCCRPAQFPGHQFDDQRRDIFGQPCDVNALATAALYHDASEILTGDLPTPIKYHNAEIMSAYHAVEDLAVQKLLGMLPPELRGTYADVLAEDKDGDIYPLVKAADKLSAYIKCIEERKAGNNEFLSAEAQTRAALEASPLPEVQYFLEHFIPAFERDLDELGAIGQ